MKHDFSNRCRSAFSLVEVTLALGIAVFCLVVVFGLMSVGLNTSSISVQQTSATNVVAAVANDLRTADLYAVTTYPKGVAVSTRVYKIALPTPIPANAAPATAPTPLPSPSPMYLDADGQPDKITNAAYQLNVGITPGVGRSATVARVFLTWPASAPITAASGSIETVVALDRN